MEIPDAYQEYIAARHEKDDAVKIATLTLPSLDMVAVWKVIADAVDEVEGLPADAKDRWESILRSLASAIREAV